MKTKNPFRSIAVPQSHQNSGQRHFRHIEGARDTRPTWTARRMQTMMRSRTLGITVMLPPFRDINPVPAGFCE